MQYFPSIVFAALLAVIAVLLHIGKGHWLIAGFNTMPPEKQNE